MEKPITWSIPEIIDLLKLRSQYGREYAEDAKRQADQEWARKWLEDYRERERADAEG